MDLDLLGLSHLPNWSEKTDRPIFRSDVSELPSSILPDATVSSYWLIFNIHVCCSDIFASVFFSSINAFDWARVSPGPLSLKDTFSHDLYPKSGPPALKPAFHRSFSVKPESLIHSSRLSRQAFFPLKAPSLYATFFEVDDPRLLTYSIFNGISTNVHCLVHQYMAKIDWRALKTL